MDTDDANEISELQISGWISPPLGLKICQWKDVMGCVCGRGVGLDKPCPRGNVLCKIGGSHRVFMQDTMVSFVFDKTTTGIFPFRTAIFFGTVICEGG